MPDLYPVFVFPSSLKFYATDQSTHKQVLSIHNPYDFAVRFKVLCSSHERKKYSVVDPEGIVNPNCCVDLTIRHNAVNAQNIGVTDKFRIQIHQIPSDQEIGRKDVIAELLSGEAVRHLERLDNTPPFNVPSAAQFPLQRRPAVEPGAFNPVGVTLGVFCAVILLLPNQGEHSSIIPDYLAPSLTLKLVAAYVLGLLTMAILRPN